MHLAPSTAWAWLISCAVIILLFPLAAQFGNLKGKLSSFRTWVWAIALLGIVTAGFMPFTFDTEITNFEIQPFIFFITGTLLGVLFLGEFHRLSALDKQEHIQRVHAERHTRYSKAVEHLAYPNPAVRASAVSTLAGLVDEWLADEQLSVEARQKEGQVIVNALCAYVRSPFARAFKAEAFESDAPPANYAGDFATDLAAFRGEQDVRRSVFVEMSKRSSTLTENEKGEVAVVPGAWSGFEFDFSRAVVFYPLDGLTIENADFSAAKFCNGSDFSGAAFVGTADFSRATFGEIAGFGDATFAGDANFTRAVFDQDARFSDVTFMGTADFSNAR
ncbi:MAG: pentapeptide repeat-containing protein, partial [Rothia mucilaginosa]